MHALILIAMRVLEALFLIGLAGSAIVVVISFVEDFMELLPGEHKSPAKFRDASGKSAVESDGRANTRSEQQEATAGTRSE